MASAAARLAFLAGLRVAVLERAQPLALRRPVTFAEAVLGGRVDIEQVEGRRVERPGLRRALDSREPFVAVCVDPDGLCLPELRPTVLVDGRMAKRNLGTTPADASLVIGLGPGFRAPRDVHAVIETQRGPELGRVIWDGEAQADTGEPAPVQGHTHGRVLRASATGVFRGRRAIGDLVTAGETVGEVDGRPVVSSIDGMVRGLLADGVPIEEGVKVGDVEPRGRVIDPTRISEKARAIAAGTLDAIFLCLAGLKAP
jgi:xanthine dehydrogenase accessory factor